ncbi:uncharacterized protein PSANT_00378 [Moesziomyces antarcticus]|uniref:Uncharacterized protein n=1 Tax=Pseudozyma antarctica TaxID=84753 RepID=A0A5C3FG75_PSEA2|nr:uncharacterized protein PSANT_00378 [Moesziomyces antarcticus]
MRPSALRTLTCYTGFSHEVSLELRTSQPVSRRSVQTRGPSLTLLRANQPVNLQILDLTQARAEKNKRDPWVRFSDRRCSKLDIATNQKKPTVVTTPSWTCAPQALTYDRG